MNIYKYLKSITIKAALHYHIFSHFLALGKELMCDLSLLSWGLLDMCLAASFAT